jgi:hypothetical protein
VDHLRAIFGRLSVALFVFVVGVLVSVCADAANTTTQAQAYASCEAALSAAPAGNVVTSACVLVSVPPVNGIGAFQLAGSKLTTQNFYFGVASPAGNPCSSLPITTVNISYAPTQTLGSSGATWTTDPSTGLSVQCPFTISYSNYSAISDANGNFHVQATMTYNGNPAGSESSTAAGGASAFNDASGNPLSPQPSSDGSTAPQLCGGTSCADPSTGNVCSVIGGAQACTKFPPWTPNMAGGCSSAGSGAVCAGSPNAPLPAQGQGGVTDPSTQISGSDHYTSENMQTGQVSTTVVNTYSGKAGQTVSNGAKTGSQSAANSSGNSKPASSSSASDGYGNGADCNSPPVCTGDAVMCGIARQEWYTMCSAKTSSDAAFKAVAGDGNGPPTFQADQSKYSQSGVWVSSSGTSGSTTGDNANAGNYDESGFGYARQCPIHDFSFTVIPVIAPLSQGCGVLGLVGPIAVGFALFAAACITAGSGR